MSVTNYTDIAEVDEILTSVEDVFTEVSGRANAKRLIGAFANVNGRNIWIEIYRKGEEPKVTTVRKTGTP